MLSVATVGLWSAARDVLTFELMARADGEESREEAEEDAPPAPGTWRSFAVGVVTFPSSPFLPRLCAGGEKQCDIGWAQRDACARGDGRDRVTRHQWYGLTSGSHGRDLDRITVDAHTF